MKLVEPLRAEIVNLLYHSKEPPRDRMLKAIRAICSLCRQKDYICPCEECQHCFKSQKGLSNHINVEHKTRGDYPCSHTDCLRHELAFVSSEQRQTHYVDVYPEGIDATSSECYPCLDCPRRRFFRTSNTLERHKRTEHPEYFPCLYEDCPRHKERPFQSVALERHLKTFHGPNGVSRRRKQLRLQRQEQQKDSERRRRELSLECPAIIVSELP